MKNCALLLVLSFFLMTKITYGQQSARLIIILDGMKSDPLAVNLEIFDHALMLLFLNDSLTHFSLTDILYVPVDKNMANALAFFDDSTFVSVFKPTPHTGALGTNFYRLNVKDVSRLYVQIEAFFDGHPVTLSIWISEDKISINELEPCYFSYDFRPSPNVKNFMFDNADLLVRRVLTNVSRCLSVLKADNKINQ